MDKIKTKVISTAKESYMFRWQRKRIRRNEKADLDNKMFGAGGDMGTGDVDRYVDEALTVEEDTYPLSKPMVTENLSCLGETATGRHAYLRVDLQNIGLTSCDILRKFCHLQHVDVSNNNLKSLEPLGELSFLLHLNASRNQLVRTQSFGPPRHLETCDLSYNMIGELGDWRCHKLLRELNLRGNFVQAITSGLRKNQQLKMLDLSENHIMRIENLDGLGLEALYLAQNQLSTLDGIEALEKLSVLNVRGNHLTSLESLQNLPNLRKLCVTENRIKSIRQVEYLQKNNNFSDFYLCPNPVADLPQYRLQVLRRLPQLRLLDDEITAPQEKTKANVAYGDDLASQEEIFTRILPREQFLDRRLVHDEAIEKKELEMFGHIGSVGFENEEDEQRALEISGMRD